LSGILKLGREYLLFSLWIEKPFDLGKLKQKDAIGYEFFLRFIY
jgi:hypothetical protein